MAAPLGTGLLRHQTELRQQRDLVVVEIPTDDPPARVEVPHLAQREGERLACRRERSERAVVGADDVEAAHHRLVGVEVAGIGDLDVLRGLNPPWQERLLELLGRRERAAL